MCHFCESTEDTIVSSLSYAPASVGFCKKCYDADENQNLRPKYFVLMKYLRNGIQFIKEQNFVVCYNSNYIQAIDFLSQIPNDEINKFEFKKALKERLVFDFLLKKRLKTISETY